jgi:hypothetical protein
MASQNSSRTVIDVAGRWCRGRGTASIERRSRLPMILFRESTGVRMAGRVIKDDQPRVYFDCNKCPAFCCSIYERVGVSKRDINRLAKHFGVSPEEAKRRYTGDHEGERVLKRVDDVIFERTCTFLDQKTRGCTIYHGARAVPITTSCASSASSRATRTSCRRSRSRSTRSRRKSSTMPTDRSASTSGIRRRSEALRGCIGPCRRTIVRSPSP